MTGNLGEGLRMLSGGTTRFLYSYSEIVSNTRSDYWVAAPVVGTNRAQRAELNRQGSLTNRIEARHRQPLCSPL